MNTRQKLMYTFHDENDEIIDLTNYTTAHLEIKAKGTTVSTITANFVSPKTNGEVEYDAYTFTVEGIWLAQFYVQDVSNNKVFGEPILFKVVENLEDLSLLGLPDA